MAVLATAAITIRKEREVYATSVYYLLQSSTLSPPAKPTTNPPGGSWVLNEPTYTSGSTNSLYTVFLTIYSDDSFDYSEVCLSSSYEAAKAAYNKADAVEVTANATNTLHQTIYISKASGTISVNPTTTWIEDTTGSQNTWTLKRPVYNSSYPVLFTATQRKTVAGTVTCTEPLKDDTTTIIDGSHITTGSIDASVVSVTNINADNIYSGTLSADRIGANSIAVGKLTGSITNGEWKIDLNAGTFTIGKMSANNLTAGTIDASVITVNNIDASKITTGALIVRDANNNIIFKADKDAKSVVIAGWTADASSLRSTNTSYASDMVIGDGQIIFRSSNSLISNQINIHGSVSRDSSNRPISFLSVSLGGSISLRNITFTLVGADATYYELTDVDGNIAHKMTGNLTIQTGNLKFQKSDPAIELKNTNLDTTLTAPSNNSYTTIANFDKNGLYQAFIQMIMNTNGDSRLALAARRRVSGADVTNMLEMKVDVNGVRSAYLTSWLQITNQVLDTSLTSGNDYQSFLIFRDKGGRAVGGIQGTDESGNVSTTFVGYKVVGSTTYSNYYRLGINSSNNPYVTFSNPAAWLTGLSSAAPTTTSTVSQIISLGSGWTASLAQFATWGKIGMLRMNVSRSTAQSSAAEVTVGTLVAGKRPVINTGGIRPNDPNKTVYITSAGVVSVYGSFAANATIAIVATFILA